MKKLALRISHGPIGAQAILKVFYLLTGKFGRIAFEADRRGVKVFQKIFSRSTISKHVSAILV